MTNQSLQLTPTESSVKAMLRSNILTIKSAFGGNAEDSKRFAACALSAVQAVPKLSNCSPRSIFTGLMTMATLRLMPSNVSGEAYLIPYGSEARFQLGYQGTMTLLKRAGAKDVRAGEVRENDEFDFSEGRVIKHKYNPFVRPTDRGEVIGYYAIIAWNDGGEYHAAMGVDELREFSETYSKSVSGKKSTPWTDSPHSRAWMCKKTVLLQAAKLAPKNDALFQAIAADARGDSTITDLNEIDRRINVAKVDAHKLSMGNIAKTDDHNQETQDDEPSVEIDADSSEES